MMNPCKKQIIPTLIAATVLAFAAHAQPFEGFEETVVFRAEGEFETRSQDVEVDGYAWYRIPAIVCTQEGTLLAFCEGRKTSVRDHGNIDLVLRRSEDNGRTWSPLQVVHEEGGDERITIGNPCPVIDQSTGTIWLPFCRNNERVFITESDDDGKTWATPKEITMSVVGKDWGWGASPVERDDWGWYATGPGVGIQLTHGPHAGRMVIPCDHREPDGDERVKKSHCFFSDDGGATWQVGESVDKHTDECQVAEAADGRVQINMRNYWGRRGERPDRAGMRAVAWSEDGGHSWSPPTFDQTLVEPVCQASLIRYPAEQATGPYQFLFSNPADTKNRRSMTVRLSPDEGKTWPVAREIHAKDAAYSNLVVLKDGTIGCLYERGENYAYETITFARFTIDWLKGNE